MRRAFAVLIAFGLCVAVYRAFASHVGVESATGTPSAADAVWALPAVFVAFTIVVALTLVSASHDGLARWQKLGLPVPSRTARALFNGAVWALVALLCVQATSSAFVPTPLGAAWSSVLFAAALGYGAYRLHVAAVDHDAYRSFNLVAMLLAAGSLASMSATGTGEWWTVNFSTLGTSDDFAAACFNLGIIVAGLGMAWLARGLTRSLTDPRFRARRGALALTRSMIVLLGLSLVGVGAVPIHTDTVLHNAFACGAAAIFALLVIGSRVLVPGLPARFRGISAAFLATEIVAMVMYDVVGVFNLTVFEIIAFTLVFAWLISLVVCTSSSGKLGPTMHASSLHVAYRRRPAPRASTVRPRGRGHIGSRRARGRASTPSRVLARITQNDEDDRPNQATVA